MNTQKQANNEEGEGCDHTSHTQKPEQNKKVNTNKVVNCKSLVIIIAMGIHGVTSGLVLGVADKMDTIVVIILANLLHKWAEAMSVGIGIVKSKVNIWMSILLINIFCLAAPLGIAIGLIFSDSNDYVKAVFGSISAGTFIYISAVEVFSEEFSGKN